MIPSIIVDPYLYSPPGTNEIEELREFVDAVLFCDGLRNDAWPQIFNCEKVAEVLAETNSFPPLDRIDEIVRLSGTDYIQPHDLNRIVNGLIRTLPTIEQDLGLEDVLVDRVESNPLLPIKSRAPQFQEILAFMFALCFLGRHCQGVSLVSTVISRGIPTDFNKAEIALRVLAAIPETDQMPTFPHEISGKTFWCNERLGLVEILDPIELWLSAEGHEYYQRTLDIHLQKEAIVGEVLSPWSFGEEFLESARSHGFLHSPARAKSLLRACTQTILQRNMQATHKLRSGPGAEDAQTTIGEFRAFRRDIDYDYHLHYWQLGNEVQLASVAIHSDMTIPSPETVTR